MIGDSLNGTLTMNGMGDTISPTASGPTGAVPRR
jgi:hypothetical protein